MTQYRAIIAGGRNYTLTASDIKLLNSLVDEIGEVVTGECPTGAGKDAKTWALFFGVPYKGFPADWDKHGKSAGPIRNSEMIAYACGMDDMIPMLIAFPGGSGTADITKKAIKRKMRIIYGGRK